MYLPEIFERFEFDIEEIHRIVTEIDKNVSRGSAEKYIKLSSMTMLSAGFDPNTVLEEGYRLFGIIKRKSKTGESLSFADCEQFVRMRCVATQILRDRQKL